VDNVTHRHVSRNVMGLTCGEIVRVIAEERIPADAVLDADIVTGVPCPVLVWRIDDSPVS
jgi:hypothetical protein